MFGTMSWLRAIHLTRKLLCVTQHQQKCPLIYFLVDSEHTRGKNKLKETYSMKINRFFRHVCTKTTHNFTFYFERSKVTQQN